jgi:hypothetical protein
MLNITCTENISMAKLIFSYTNEKNIILDIN